MSNHHFSLSYILESFKRSKIIQSTKVKTEVNICGKDNVTKTFIN